MVIFSTSSLSDAILILYRIICNFNLGEVLLHKYYMLGMAEDRFFILFIEIAIVVFVDILHERNTSIVNWLNKQNVIFRWGHIW